MEETVDLRPYLAALGRYLWLIGGAVVLAIVIAVAIYLTSNDYEAIALLTVPEPVSYTHLDVYKRQDPARPPVADGQGGP